MEVKKIKLGTLLEQLSNCEITLPDFQRSWIWNDEQIKYLLQSVIRNFPINSILLLECNPAEKKFVDRPIEGVNKRNTKPQYLILDGQQRVTSLFGALFSNDPVTITGGKRSKKFFYYVDMRKAVNAVKNSVDEDDLIISVPEDKKLKAKGKNFDLSTPEKEFAASMFPLNKIFQSRPWLNAYKKFHDNAAAEDLADEFDDKIVDTIKHYEIATIELEKNIPPEAVCKIFENVNIGGVKLGVFELLTSIFAAKTDSDGEPIKLRSDRDNILQKFRDMNLTVLSDVNGLDFITALTLFVGYKLDKTAVSCNGKDILNLDCANYLRYRDDIADGFIETGKFLEQEGVVTTKYLPYTPQLINMAALFTELKLSGKLNEGSRKKIRQWYWFSVFSESYRDGAKARCIKDFVDVMKWIERNDEPKFFKNTISAQKLLKPSSGTSAIYKGFVAIFIRNGARDFMDGRGIRYAADYAESVEIHHVFPKKYCAAQNFRVEAYDSTANKMLILRGTNRTIGDNKPSVYLEKIQRNVNLTVADVNEILAGHFIDAELCRADNFTKFIVARAKKLLDAVESLTGRKVSGRDSIDIKNIFGEALT